MLNPEQKQCVETIHGPLLLIAGAGTGKTRVTTMRMGHMIKSGIAPDAIAAVTFTNKAAFEMKERLAEICGNKAKKIRIGTFHSFCLRILRQYASMVGLRPKFKILDAQDQLDLIKKSLEEKSWNGQYKPEWIQSAISKAKNALLGPKDINDFEFGLSYDNDSISTIYDLYERQLQLNQVIDFDDCIFKTVKLFAQHPEVISTLGITHMLVDEYQDTNDSQLEVIKAICRDQQNICVVGDDDQSIYSWRGANSQIFFNFLKTFPEAKTIKLEQNYRCTKVILEAANAVIANNAGRNVKNLWSEYTSTNKIILKNLPNETEEADWITRKIMSFLARDQKERDIAILYRTNAQSRALELSLKQANITYKIYGGQSFFERKEIKDLMAYIRLIVDPYDRMAFLRIINVPPRGMGIKSLERLSELAMDRSLFHTLEKSPEVASSADKVAEFFSNYDSLRSTLPRSPEEIPEWVEKIIANFRLKSYIRAQASDEMTAQFRLRLLSHTAEFLKRVALRLQAENSSFSMDDLIAQLTLSPQDQNEDSQSNHVSLMSIHSAKGLEFPCVFIAGLEEGILPHKNSLAPSSLMEERRLMYVAITRAKKQLILTHCSERQLQEKIPQRASRFLSEIPSSCLEEESTPSKDESRERTLGRLKSLRHSLQDGEAKN
jgi:DNA helicase II / ATP-dependent DNA helicase PcrA